LIPEPWDERPTPVHFATEVVASSQGLGAIRLDIRTATGRHVSFMSPETAKDLARRLINDADAAGKVAAELADSVG
jgi:hypothetical protein